MMAEIFDQTACYLGEGPLWHPERGQLYWFDIIGKTLRTRTGDSASHWQFGEHVSAAGWVDRDTLLVASETALLRFDLVTGGSETVCKLEADNPATRSNDGRADPWGGFWIGTMGKNAEVGAGAIYRYYRGELRRLYTPVSIPNAICFSPDRRFAYFTDTTVAKVWRQALEPSHGWPDGEPVIYLDLDADGLRPDGAVCDSQGYFWNAQWGAGRLARYSPEGDLVAEIGIATDHASCPAFGGDDLRTLYATSAIQGLRRDQRDAQPDAGKTFVTEVEVPGQAEHRVIL